jgi:hypothetical protein
MADRMTNQIGTTTHQTMSKPITIAPPRPPTRCDCTDLRIEHPGGKACKKCPCDVFIPQA